MEGNNPVPPSEVPMSEQSIEPSRSKMEEVMGGAMNHLRQENVKYSGKLFGELGGKDDLTTALVFYEGVPRKLEINELDASDANDIENSREVKEFLVVTKDGYKAIRSSGNWINRGVREIVSGGGKGYSSKQHSYRAPGLETSSGTISNKGLWNPGRAWDRDLKLVEDVSPEVVKEILKVNKDKLDKELAEERAKEAQENARVQQAEEVTASLDEIFGS